LIDRVESLSKPEDTSYTKHTQPETRGEMENRGSFENIMEYGTLLSKKKRALY